MTASKIDNEKRPACAIIGAGIAGLSAAIALRRAGWDVEVSHISHKNSHQTADTRQIYEKTNLRDESGAAVTLGCNASRVLRRWGADFNAWHATENRQVSLLNNNLGKDC